MEALFSEEGMNLEEVKALYINKKGNKLHSEQMISFEEANARIWDLGADIFIPGAASKLVTKDQVDRLILGDIEVISCGANVPFVDDGIFFGPTATFADEALSLIPDFIANCGMARVFAYLMQPDVAVTDDAIFNDVSDTIRNGLLEVKNMRAEANLISQTALQLALDKLL